jgi:hydrogenase nickel incorporation protein HypA/HybF
VHEFSLATALLEQVRRHVPAGGRLKRVTIEAGPLQGLDPQAMEWAWRSVVDGTPFEQAAIEIIFTRWRLHCPACGNEYAADELAAPCPCGGGAGYPAGGDELRLMSLTIDEPEPDDAGAGRRECPEAQR